MKTENKIKRIKKTLILFEKYHHCPELLKEDYSEIYKEWKSDMQSYKYENDADVCREASEKNLFELLFAFMYKGWERKPYKFKRLSDLK